ncbi:MAG TPA: prepilin-type N-terminal cleavage/methylation domain-containing protein [Phycisphaerae bacterium]|nr:prepilin-type N-terminal cleavage/methylation domain-containing protein [Phycisphaerae bacterium]
MGRSAKKSAFTLIELLVVVAIIALLIAILLPSLGKARQKARTTKCLSNTKNLGMSVQLYVADWQRMLPFTGATTDSWTQVLRKGGGYGALDALRLCPEALESVTQNAAVQPWWGAARFAWGNSVETGPDPVTNKPLIASYGLNGHLYSVGPNSQIATIGGSAAHSYTLPLTRSDTNVPVFADCDWRHVLPFPTDGIGAGNLQNPDSEAVSGPQPMSHLLLNRHNQAINISYMDGHAVTVPLRNLWGLYWSRDWVPKAAPTPFPTK